MIKAAEVRIGNAIWDDTRNKVKWVNHRVISDLASHANPLPYSPIPLTPEWLERCGFAIETIPDSVDEEGDIIKGYTHWTNGKFCFHFSDGKVEGREHIQYVHLFQNWYYFNTSEELTIKAH